MHPTIFSIGLFAIRSYGLLLAGGFLTGIMVAAWRARRMGEKPDHIYNLSVWLVISSLIGARIYYVVTHYSEFSAAEANSLFMRIIIELKNMFWPVGPNGQFGISGLVLYGGLILATVVAVLYLKKHKLSVLKYMDILAPSLGLGEFFTRIGCFLNGCCFGLPTDSGIGVVFPENSAAGYYFPGTPIHPAQLYSSFLGLMIFVLLLLLERYRKFNGYTAMLYFILYAAGRFIIDFFRYYEDRLKVWGMNHNQIVSMAVFTGASVVFIVLSVRARTQQVS